MVSSEDLITVIADRLRHYKARNIVLDPVMVATSGSSLMKSEAVGTMIQELFRLLQSSHLIFRRHRFYQVCQ